MLQLDCRDILAVWHIAPALPKLSQTINDLVKFKLLHKSVVPPGRMS